MKYELSLTIHDDGLDSLETIGADTLIQLCAQFVLVMGRLEVLHTRFLKNKLADKEDDIPF